VRRCLAAFLAELLVLEFTLDFLLVLVGIVIRVLARGALEANQIVLWHMVRSPWAVYCGPFSIGQR